MTEIAQIGQEGGKYFWSKLKVDWIMFFSALTISILGLFTMNSFTGSDTFFHKQIIWIIVSVSVFFLLSFGDYRFLKKTKVVVTLYVFFLILLLLIFAVGKISMGAQKWFDFGLFAFQPSDTIKLVMVILFAKYSSLYALGRE